FSMMRHPSAGGFNLIAAFLVACNTAFAAWSTGGLESTLFAFMILLSIYAHDRHTGSGRGALIAALPPAIASLVRADGFVLFGILSAWRLLDTLRRRERIPCRANVIWIATFALVFFPFFVWRL